MEAKPLRAMAIDYGEKRVGIASTDETGLFAIPRLVLENNKDLVEKIIDFKDKNKIDLIVIGESKDFKGQDNPIQVQIDKFKSHLENLGAKVLSHQEILTTVEARRLQGNTKMTDASAASLILKSFIDTMYNKEHDIS